MGGHARAIGAAGALRQTTMTHLFPRAAGGGSLLSATLTLPARVTHTGAPATSEHAPAADEGVPRAPAVDIDMTAEESVSAVDESAQAVIKWSCRDFPRFALLFVERHGESDPVQLKPPQIRALALAMLSSDKQPAIETIKRQLINLKTKGVARAWQPSSRGQQPRTTSSRRGQPRALSVAARAGAGAIAPARPSAGAMHPSPPRCTSSPPPSKGLTHGACQEPAQGAPSATWRRGAVSTPTPAPERCTIIVQ